MEAHISNLELEFQEKQSDLSELKSNADSIVLLDAENFQQIQNQLENLKNQSLFHELRRKYDQDLESLNSIKNQEQLQRAEEIQKISENLWKEYSKTELSEMIFIQREFIKDQALYNSHLISLKKLQVQCDKATAESKDISEIELAELCSKITLAKQELKNIGKIYSCPSCNSNLELNNEKLEFLTSSKISESAARDLMKKIKMDEAQYSTLKKSFDSKKSTLVEIEKINQSIQELKSKYEDIEDDLSESLKCLEDLFSEQSALEARLKFLNNSPPHSSVSQELEKNLLALQRKVDFLKPSVEVDCDKTESELTQIISEEKIKKSAWNELSRGIKKLEIELNNNRIRLQDLNEKHAQKYGCLNKNLVKEIEEISINLEEKKTIQQENELLVQKIEEFKYFETERIRYQSAQQKKCDLEILTAKAEKELTSARTLQSKIKDAEYLALQNVVSTINTHAEWYLDRFFVEDPISVTLKTTKEREKDFHASVINMDIHYKGSETDIDMLSGGERARVMLAYTLALGELFNVPMLMLDECTASLDMETTTTVIEAIRESYFANKLILIIAHQVVSGIFDKNIHL